MAELMDVGTPVVEPGDMTDDDRLPGRRDGVTGLAAYTLGKLKTYLLFGVAALPDGVGNALKFLRVNATEDGYEWATPDVADAVPFSLGFGFTTALEASEKALLYTFAEAITFADDFADSVGDVGTNPAATFTMEVQKNGAAVGTIAISTGGAFTFATTGGSVSFAIGDRISVLGPGTAGTAADVSVTLLGARD